MLPSSTITALSLAQLDIGHHLGLRRSIPIGAAALTGHVAHGRVNFTFDSFVLQPSDPADDLLRWLDQRLAAEDATLAGYELSAATQLLDALPNAGWSPAMRSLAGCGTQSLLDISAREVGGALLSFKQACAYSHIAVAEIDPVERFTAWCESDTDGIVHQTEIDAIATWRLVMHRIAAIDSLLSRKIARALNTHFAAWLIESSHGAARIHAGDIDSIFS